MNQYRVAVITPYYKEDIEVLRQCHQSVINQDVNLTHFFIADGHPNKELNQWDCKHIMLPDSHGDNGNTPRGIGSLLAESEGYDFIAYLDADNWYHPNHLKSLLTLHDETGGDVMCSFRTFHRMDGSILPISEEIENSLKHVDTSCLMISKKAFSCLTAWTKMPKALSPACDRIFYKLLKYHRFDMRHTQLRTVAFRSQYQAHYIGEKELPLHPLKDSAFMEGCSQYLQSVTGIRECLDTLGFWPLQVKD